MTVYPGAFPSRPSSTAAGMPRARRGPTYRVTSVEVV
jgi:hypothetical protein